jgi:hypothetical protein
VHQRSNMLMDSMSAARMAVRYGLGRDEQSFDD